MVEALGHKIQAGQLQLYCVDSIDWESLYCDWCHPADRLRRHSAFEEYVLNEVLPFMAMKNPAPLHHRPRVQPGGLPRRQYRAAPPPSVPEGRGLLRAL